MTTTLTAPANAIYNYRVRVKSIDTAPPLGHVDSGPNNMGDAIWVKTPHGQCSAIQKGNGDRDLQPAFSSY